RGRTRRSSGSSKLGTRGSWLRRFLDHRHLRRIVMSPLANTKKEYCDLVMKGGITSGVVYPPAITELSQKYLFRNIGGTSAGAVAAVLTAAAEYGRRTGISSGYDLLAGLPKRLGENNLLLNLFQPTTAAVRIFRVLLAALKAKSTSGRILKASVALVYQFWGWSIVGIVFGGRRAGSPILLLRRIAYCIFGARNLLGCRHLRTHRVDCGGDRRAESDDRQWLWILLGL